ncbi:MAG TPA: DnaJ domain-containing protein [Ktedonobacteraceae bacterium]|nr:DnaJ domain-containing protein [Ktedonobacteraceae bacterium]
MQDFQDYYALLGVKPDATVQEIKRAYHRLARLHHPDLNQTALDDHIKRLNEAYEVLRNPQKRSDFDAQLAQRATKITAQKDRKQARREPEMSWVEGAFGFVKELKKGLKDE